MIRTFMPFQGSYSAGAQSINQVAISFVMDPAFNPFVAGGATKFLYVESSTPSGGQISTIPGMIASGYLAGTNFDKHDATTLHAALNNLGTVYGGLVVSSDFGGILSQAELDILNARKADIANFVNNGGGIYAMAESNDGAMLTPNGGQFDFLPIVSAAVALTHEETGNTVTPFGASLGLTNDDVNGNFSHVFFTNIGSLTAVDLDAEGRIISAAGRTFIVPEPGTGCLLLGGAIALMGRQRRTRMRVFNPVLQEF